MKTSPTQFLLLWALALLAGCQAGTGPGATTSVNQQDAVPAQVDVKGYINTRDYDQGQVLLFVEGQTGPGTRFSQAQVLVNPVTQITDTNGKRMSMNDLQIGQQVSVVFMGKYRLGGVGRTAQATARRIWIEAQEAPE